MRIIIGILLFALVACGLFLILRKCPAWVKKAGLAVAGLLLIVMLAMILVKETDTPVNRYAPPLWQQP